MVLYEASHRERDAKEAEGRRAHAFEYALAKWHGCATEQRGDMAAIIADAVLLERYLRGEERATT